MTLPDHNLRPEPLLQQLEREWRAHGWQTSDLARYRMDGDPPPNPPKPDPPKPDPTPAPTFTQDDLNRIATKEKEEGKRAAEKAITDLLGCTAEEAKAILDAKREEDKGKMTEAERLAKEAAESKTKADQAGAEAATEKRTALIERALYRCGFRDDPEDKDAKGLAYALRMVEPDVPADADLDKAIAVISEAAKKFPAIFGGTEGSGAPSGDPSGRPPARKGADGLSGVEAGRERARQEREARNGKNSDPFAGMTKLG